MKKWEKERLEKQKLKAEKEKEKAEREKSDKVIDSFVSAGIFFIFLFILESVTHDW